MSTPNGSTAVKESSEVMSKDKLMSKAYTASQKRLREAHSDEFNGYMQEETAKLGLDWKPRLSPEERALADVLAMLEANPGLADKLAEKLSSQPS